MCLMKYAPNQTLWQKFPDKSLENHQRWNYLLGNLKPGGGFKQIFEVRVWASNSRFNSLPFLGFMLLGKPLVLYFLRSYPEFAFDPAKYFLISRQQSYGNDSPDLLSLQFL